MPQIKVIVQQTQSALGVTGATFGDAIPLAGALTVSAQMAISNPATPGSASAVFQVSNRSEDTVPDSSEWSDYGSSQNITASGNLFFEKVNPSGNWLRLKFAIASGSFDASTKFVVKGPN